ncbi:cytochrome P450 [Lineolata rhizophorae]|uniref:Cytochrome P450 n=1 Tax=Lineolata rhizophorae TaxID=578093 RepID=A0A6A6PEL1_9PEZI|nr:cytochrome P450 [Lineolata rhizophorae]
MTLLQALAGEPGHLIWAAVGLAILAPLGFYLYVTPSSLKDSRRRHLPPGPRGLPFVGNLFDLADTNKMPYIVRDWAKKYGHIFYTKIGGTDYVWLSSPRAVKDLMDKRSSIYNSRPHLPLAQDVASAGRRQLFLEYGPRWRNIRKVAHALLNATAATNYKNVQDYESKQLMQELIDDPAHFYEHNRRYSASVITVVTYGFRLPTWEDPMMKKIYSVLDNFTEMTAPGAFAVDSFPSLARLPQQLLGNWRDKGRSIFEHDSKVYLDLWNDLKRKVDNGTANPCFCKDFYLKRPEKEGVDELQSAYTCGGLVEAGAETTGVTLNNFVLAMCLWPEVPKKAQQELDKVVGPDRLPDWEDEKDLPYVRSLIKETLRWRPLNKFGMSHASSDDDWYDGFFIPKGSVIMLNWWAIHMDPTLHPEPDEFKPERYLNHTSSAADYMNSADPYDRDHFGYGAGRRACPGVHVAERSLFINIARTLWGFDITKKRAPDGQFVEPNTEMVPGFMTVPGRFDCDIRVRSDRHQRTIANAFSKAEAEGLQFGK